MKEDYKSENFFEGKNILISGGTGSIGRDLVKKLLDFDPKVIRILSNDEDSLFNMQQGLQEHVNLRFLLGDVRDKNRLRMAIRDIDIVFHVAALKHVPICEYNPFEAVKTNVIGTQNLIEVSIFENVQKFIFISTDKAVNPTSTMGATKLLCERLTIDASSYKGKQVTKLCCVRFGNVLGTRGSVFRIFEKEIRSGGPVTITQPDMTRFVMLPSQAVDLVLKAATFARGGEIFILKMPALKIIDLAKVIIQELAPKYGYSPHSIKIKNIGKRAGEKICEELMTCYEAENAIDLEDMYVTFPLRYVDEVPSYYQGYEKAKISALTSQTTQLLSQNEIVKLVKTFFEDHNNISDSTAK